MLRTRRRMKPEPTTGNEAKGCMRLKPSRTRLRRSSALTAGRGYGLGGWVRIGSLADVRSYLATQGISGTDRSFTYRVTSFEPP